MNAVRRFVERLAGFVGGFWFTPYLCPERARNDITDNRARMTVRCGGVTRSVVDFNDCDGELVTIQLWQIVRESDSCAFSFLLIRVSAIPRNNVVAGNGCTRNH